MNNLQMNGFQERFHARSEAVSNFTGDATFYIPPGLLPTVGRLNGHTLFSESLQELPVTVTTLDHVCQDWSGVDLVKIDVEGHEDRVLEGSVRVLRDHAPIIVLEYHRYCPVGKAEQVLKDADYLIFRLTPDCQLLPVERMSAQGTEKQPEKDFLCVPKSRLSLQVSRSPLPISDLVQ